MRLSGSLLWAGVLVVLCGLAGAPSRADVLSENGFRSPTFDVQIFRPAQDPYGYVTVHSSRVLPHQGFSLSLSGDYAMQPLRYERAPRLGVDGFVVPCDDFTAPRTFEVRHLATPRLQISLGLFDRVQLGVDVPFSVLSGGRRVCPDGNCQGLDVPALPGVYDSLDFTYASLGDVALQFKAAILRQTKKRGTPLGLNMGVGLTVTLPVSAWVDAPFVNGNRGLLGETYPTVRPLFVVDRLWGRSGRLRTSLNLGAIVRVNSFHHWDQGLSEGLYLDQGKPGLANIDLCYPIDPQKVNPEDPMPAGVLCGTGIGRRVGTQLSYGLGVGLTLVPGRLELIGELSGLADLTVHEVQVTVEAADGTLTQEPRTTLGYNRAFPLEGYGALRVQVAKPLSLLLGAGGGIYGVTAGGLQTGAALLRAFANLTVTLPGVTPEERYVPPPPPPPDRDKDGIPDARDRCPTQPEDRDDYQDDDGCPEPDNDRDGVLDIDDGCADQPGPKENFGCPDTDKDGDGLVDRLDKCPEQPEDKDDFEDQDGCPDPDNDGDGVLDKDDQCPDQPGSRANQGCAERDQDHDGTVDRVDKCKAEPGPPPDGCPSTPTQVVAEPAAGKQKAEAGGRKKSRRSGGGRRK